MNNLILFPAISGMSSKKMKEGDMVVRYDSGQHPAQTQTLRSYVALVNVQTREEVSPSDLAAIMTWAGRGAKNHHWTSEKNSLWVSFTLPRHNSNIIWKLIRCLAKLWEPHSDHGPPRLLFPLTPSNSPVTRQLDTSEKPSHQQLRTPFISSPSCLQCQRACQEKQSIKRELASKILLRRTTIHVSSNHL